jgi:Immunity protein 72/Immunity protein 71
MMTEQDRSKVFWLLKKYSSYTAWKALGDAYFAFSDAYYTAHKLRTVRDIHAPDRKEMDEWMAGHLKEVLDGRIGFEQGLPRLKQGDRSVWRRTSRGALAVGGNKIYFIGQIMNEREFVLDWMKNKSDVQHALLVLDERNKGLGSVTERLPERGKATWGEKSVFDPFYGPFNFPPQLPEVPHPTNIVIATGEEVPFDGIYEPEWGPLPDAPNRGLLDKIKTLLGNKPSLMNDQGGDGLATVRHRDIGCMNYLLSCTQAPLYQDGELDPAIPVHWRLIWQDTRYLDGVIPDEEVEYLAAVSESVRQYLRCEAGQPCPAEGEWSTPALQGTRHFKQGEMMPDLKSDYGQTIWYCGQQQ